MKTILIEAVSNGWIVRPFCPGPEWSVCDRPVIAVYNDLWKLADDLPELLGVVQEPLFSPAPTPLEISTLRTLTGNPPPLAARDSDGGNTGL